METGHAFIGMLFIANAIRWAIIVDYRLVRIAFEVEDGNECQSWLERERQTMNSSNFLKEDGANRPSRSRFRPGATFAETCLGGAQRIHGIWHYQGGSSYAARRLGVVADDDRLDRGHSRSWGSGFLNSRFENGRSDRPSQRSEGRCAGWDGSSTNASLGAFYRSFAYNSSQTTNSYF